MILRYRKIDLQPVSQGWVSADAFNRQMADLQAYDVVTLDDYEPANPDHAVITFDGVSANVATFAGPILEKWGYPFELFVVGDRIGRSSTLDPEAEPPAPFASLDELEALTRQGGRVQWHTASYVKLSELDDAALAHELTPPAALRRRFGSGHLGWFAHPHGEHDARVRAAVAERFDGAVSVVPGEPDDRYARRRSEVDEQRNLSRSTVAVIVPNHNYGRFLPEAMDSLFKQTGRVDEILLIDDASTDGSQEVVDRYADRVRVEKNAENLGIVENFRKAVSLTTSDYVVFLGADNRMRSDFVERAKAALDANPDAAVAYTDMSIFGGRSHDLAQKVGADPTAADDVYLWRFPDPTPERLAAIDKSNFIHGSSMYRRADYDAVGGYRTGDGPEDHDLFTRMLLRGRGAVRVAEPVLEYRQHSEDQANTRLAAQLEAAHQARIARELKAQLEATEAELEAANAELARLTAQVADLEGRAVDDPGELVWLRQRADTLAAVEAGGWWRLRGALLPVLRVGRRILRHGNR
jgi:peptidoglycan/xylan/chitin deacetylase (PgdA/CDA1 family)